MALFYTHCFLSFHWLRLATPSLALSCLSSVLVSQTWNFTKATLASAVDGQPTGPKGIVDSLLQPMSPRGSLSSRLASFSSWFTKILAQGGLRFS